MSNRVASLDVKIGAKVKVRILGVYMPHALMPDEEVDAVYAAMEEALCQARQKGYRIIIAGDLNAEVGRKAEDDDPNIIGDNPMPKRSERGEL